MPLDRFINERKTAWKRLEELLHLVEALKQFLESLPDGLAFIDEAIKGHGFDCGLRIADFGFVILDLD